jgi:membrane protein implicated in regulation of membrane protease activity
VANGAAVRGQRAGRAFLTYNLLRLGLLAVCLGLGWLAGLRSYFLVLAALLVSGVLSWFLLRSQREAMGLAVEQTVERGRARIAERTTVEDAYVETLDTPELPSDRPAS